MNPDISILSKIYLKLTGHRSRVNYWSCGVVSKWIQKRTNVDEKPESATMEEWDEYHKSNQYKFWYWVTDELLDTFQNIWMFIPDVYNNLRYFIKNRYIDKPHYIDTKLKKGEWHEFDDRILHGVMEALVDFVEVEKAHMMRWTTKQKFKTPNADMGLDYLTWEMSPETPEKQQKNAAETIAIYSWWKHIRPNRPDPYETSGLNAFYEKLRVENNIEDAKDHLHALSAKTPEQQKEWEKCHKKLTKLEVEYYNEDNDMLIRVINLRQDLWT